MLRKYRQTIFIFCVTALVSFVMVYLALNEQLERVPFPLPSVMQKPVAEMGNMDNREIKVKYYYLACQHTVFGSLPRGVDITGLSIDEIREKLPREQGWLVELVNGLPDITKYEEGFCPEDEKKSHLGAVGEFVAVFQGPVGVNSHIMEVTDIPIVNLPSDWQDQLRRGELDFDSVKRLKETLDSLDEYSPGEYRH